MELPCIDCLCVPACKNKTFNNLMLTCEPIRNYVDEMECFVPLNSYRYIDIKPLKHRYKIRKDFQSNCRWYREGMFVGTSTHI